MVPVLDKIRLIGFLAVIGRLVPMKLERHCSTCKIEHVSCVAGTHGTVDVADAIKWRLVSVGIKISASPVSRSSASCRGVV